MGYNIHYLKLQETKDSNLKVNIYIFMTGYIYDLLKNKNQEFDVERGGKEQFCEGRNCQ